MALPSYDEVINNSQKDTAMPSFSDVVGDGSTTIPSFQDVMTSEPQQDPGAADSAFRYEQSHPNRDLPVIGPILQGLDAFSENPYVDAAASVARSFYTPGAGIANVGGLSNAVDTGISKILPGLSSNVLGRTAQGLARETMVGAPIGAGQVLTQGGQLDDAAQGALYGAAFGGALGAAGPLAGKGLQALGGKLTGTKAGDYINQFSDHANQAVEPLPDYSNVTLSQGKGIGEAKPMPFNKPVTTPDISTTPNEPVNLDELMNYKGYPDATPENIAQVYNDKTWYHGTGTDKLTAETLDPFVGSHESLFGQGVYLTDNPKIAEGYANSRGKRSKTPTIYEANVNVNRVLDLEKPITPDVYTAIDKTVKPLDYQYNYHFEEPDHFTNLIRSEVDKGSTPEQIITKLRSEVTNFSHEAEIPTSEFVSDFQDLAVNLKQAGYDAITHTGGLHTGKDPHRVMIMLDPQNWHGATEGKGSQVTKFDKYNQPQLENNGPFKSMPSYKDTILNSDAKDIIQLTPAEIARNERIDQFSKVEDNPIIPNTADQIQSKTGRDAIPLLDRANDLYIKTVDNAHRTNQFDQAAAAAKGGELNPSDSAYMLQLNARGHDMQSSQIVNKNMIDAQGNITGQSLADITKQIPKGQEQAFNDYVVAQHSIDRMGRGEQVYSADKEMTVQKAKAIVDQYNATNPEFKAISEQYTKFHQDFAQQWYVDTGLFKQSQLDAAKEANPNYVPNKRIFSDIEQKTAFNSKGGVAGQTNPVKRYDPAGSQRPIVSPIESSIEDIAKGVKTARNNEAGQAIVRSLQRNPDELSGFAEIVHDQPKLNVDEMLQKDGMDGVIDHINKSFEDATRKPDTEKGNVVTVLVNGEPVHVRVYDPQFLEAISNLSPKGQDYVTAAVGKVTKVMKNLTTGVNPIFGLTRNVARDIPHGFIASKTTSNPIRYGADLVDGLTSVLADSMSRSKLAPDFMKGWLETRGQLYNDYKNMGGGHSSPTAADRNLLAQTKEKILPSTGIGQTLKRNLITKPYHALENLNNATEAAPRLGEYKRVVNQGGGTYDAKVKGLYEANNLTVNFNKFGNVTKNVDAYIPYLNAAVQGLDQVAKMYTQGGTKQLTQVYAKSIGALTLPTVVLYMLNHDNPDYQQVSNFVKDNNLLIPNGDGTFTKIPKPREMGMIFSTGVERALRAFNDHDPRAFQDFAHNFLQNFLPPGAGGAVQGFKEKGLAGIPSGILSDTIAGPIQSIASNKDFANRDIVPRDLTGLSPELQYDSKTSEIAKLIGHIMNSSPKQLDYLAKSYGGVLAQMGIPLTTKGGSLADTLKQQVTVDPAFSNDISRNFYDQKVKSDTAKADSKFTGEQKDNMSKYYDNVAARFTNIRKQMKRVQNDNSLSNTEKRAQLRGLQQSLNEIQQQATQ